jgi:hypothetical protein
MDQGDDDRGLLGEYGVLIVPPSGESDAWLVTLGGWDDDSGGYITGSDGPLFGTREEAIAEAHKALDWLAQQTDDEVDLLDTWQKMQEVSAVENGLIERSRYRARGPLGL